MSVKVTATPIQESTYTISGLSKRQLQALTLLVGITGGTGGHELYKQLWNALGSSHVEVVDAAQKAHPDMKLDGLRYAPTFEE